VVARRLQFVVLVCLLAAVSAAAAGPRPGALPPPGIRSNPAWHTVTTGPTTASQQLPPQLFAVTASAKADALIPFGVFAGLKNLGADDALIWASTLRRGGYANAFKPAAWPPRLSEFRVDHGWEGQPLPRIQQRLLALTTGGWSLDVRIYFGTQHPGKALLASVQAELERLTLPVSR
jgi:hypothetical protein